MAALIVGEQALREQTLFGDDLLRIISDVIGNGDDAEMSIQEVAKMVLSEMKRAGMFAIKPAPHRKMLAGGGEHKCVVREVFTHPP